MSDTKKTGGPAFPVTLQAWDKWTGTEGIDGMTLRDYFAAKAMQSLIAFMLENLSAHKAEDVPEIAYDFADAMLKAREE
jgi:hypothetical protein